MFILRPIPKGFLILAFAFGLSSGRLIFEGDFESGTLQGNPNWRPSFCCDYSAQIVTLPVRCGRYALKTLLRDDDPIVANGIRAEVMRAHSEKYITDSVGQEYWYGFSLMFPSDWVADNVPEMVAQWHQLPDSGEIAKSPPLSVYVSGSQMSLRTRWDSRPITPYNNAQGSRTVWSTAVEPGKWIDLVVHVKWSFGSDGLIALWKDGKPVAEHLGSNCYNDQYGPRFKVGIYKWSWKSGSSIVSQRIMHHDEVRVADSQGSYQMVAPSTFRVRGFSKPSWGRVPLSVRLDAVAMNGVGSSSFQWIFGDGQAGTGQSLPHLYQNPKAYMAKVVAHDETGKQSDPSLVEIKALSQSDLRFTSLAYTTAIVGHAFSYQVQYTNEMKLPVVLRYLQTPHWVVAADDSVYGMPKDPGKDTVLVALSVHGPDSDTLALLIDVQNTTLVRLAPVASVAMSMRFERQVVELFNVFGTRVAVRQNTPGRFSNPVALMIVSPGNERKNSRRVLMFP